MAAGGGMNEPLAHWMDDRKKRIHEAFAAADKEWGTSDFHGPAVTPSIEMLGAAGAPSGDALHEQVIRTAVAHMRDPKYEWVMAIRMKQHPGMILSLSHLGGITGTGQRGISIYLSQWLSHFINLFGRFQDEGPGPAGMVSKL